jgi:hypothetical protein
LLVLFSFNHRREEKIILHVKQLRQCIHLRQGHVRILYWHDRQIKQFESNLVVTIKKITPSLMKCANSWRRPVSSTNALINESVAKAKMSNTAGNVSTSVMSSSKAKEDIVDCHWCCFVFCFLVLLLELCHVATFAAVALCFFLADRDDARETRIWGVTETTTATDSYHRPSTLEKKNLEGKLWILHKFHSLCSRF